MKCFIRIIKATGCLMQFIIATQNNHNTIVSENASTSNYLSALVQAHKEYEKDKADICVQLNNFNDKLFDFKDFCIDFIQDMLDIKEQSRKIETKDIVFYIFDVDKKNNLFFEELDRYFKIKIYLDGMSELLKREVGPKKLFPESEDELMNYITKYFNDVLFSRDFYNDEKTKDFSILLIKKTKELKEDVKKLETQKTLIEEDLYKYTNQFIKLAEFYWSKAKYFLYNYCITLKARFEKEKLLRKNKGYADNYMFELLENIAINLTKCYLRLDKATIKNDFPFENVEYLMMCNKINRFISFAKKTYSKDYKQFYEPFFNHIKNTTIFMMDTFYKNEKKIGFLTHEFNNPYSLINEFKYKKAMENIDFNKKTSTFIKNVYKSYIGVFFNSTWWNLGLYLNPKTPYFNLFFLKALKNIEDINLIEYYKVYNLKKIHSYRLAKIIYSFCRLTIETMLMKFEEFDIKTKYEEVCYQIVNNGISVLNEQGNEFCNKIDDNIGNQKNITFDEFYEKIKGYLVVNDFIVNIKNKTIEEIEFILPEQLFNALISCYNIKNNDTKVKITKEETLYYAYKKHLLKVFFINTIESLINKVINNINITCSDAELSYVCNLIKQNINDFEKKNEEVFWSTLKKLFYKNVFKNSCNQNFEFFIKSFKEYKMSLRENTEYKNIKTNTFGIFLLNVFPLFWNWLFSIGQMNNLQTDIEEFIICSLIHTFSKTLEKTFNINDKSVELARFMSFKTIELFYHELNEKTVFLLVSDIYDFIEKQNLNVKEQKNNNEFDSFFDIKSMFLKDLSLVSIDKHLVMEILEEVLEILEEDVFQKILNTYLDIKNINFIFKNIKCIVGILGSIKKIYLTNKINSLIEPEFSEFFRNEYKHDDNKQYFINMINEAKSYIYEDFDTADKLIFLSLRRLANSKTDKAKEIIKNELSKTYDELSNFYCFPNREHLHETVIRQTIFSFCQNFLLENPTVFKKEIFKKIEARYLLLLKRNVLNSINTIYLNSLIDLYKKFKKGDKILQKYSKLKKIKDIEREFNKSDDLNIEDFFKGCCEISNKKNLLMQILEKSKNVEIFAIDKKFLLIKSIFFCSKKIDYTYLDNKNYIDISGLININRSIFSNTHFLDLVENLLKKYIEIEEFYKIGDISKLTDKSADKQKYNATTEEQYESTNSNTEMEKDNEIYIIVANLVILVIQEIDTKYEKTLYNT